MCLCITYRTIPDNPAQCIGYDCNNDLRYGMHEDFDYYFNCKQRNRNGGLFLADQVMIIDSLVGRLWSSKASFKGVSLLFVFLFHFIIA